MVYYFETLRRSQKIYNRALEPVCRRWGLTHNELDVLLFLAHNAQYDRAADIVEHRGIAKSHASMAVRSLCGRGLLMQQPDPKDHRNTHLRLTEQALTVVGEGQTAQRNFFAEVFQGLSQEDMALWRKVIEQLCRNIEKLDG